MQRKPFEGSPVNPIVALIVLVLVVVGMFMLARFVFRILTFLAPVLIIAALILDYRTVIGYGKWLVDLVRRNPLLGIAAIVLTIFGFPLVAAFLAGKALLARNARKTRKEQEQQPGLRGEYIYFEEVEEDRPLELPELSRVEREENPPPPPEAREEDERRRRKKKNDEDSDYDKFFE